MPRSFWKPAEATIWISRPSSTHENPRPTTIDQWNFVQGSRSIRAGTRLSRGVVSAVCDMSEILRPHPKGRQRLAARGREYYGRAALRSPEVSSDPSTTGACESVPRSFAMVFMRW